MRTRLAPSQSFFGGVQEVEFKKTSSLVPISVDLPPLVYEAAVTWTGRGAAPNLSQFIVDAIIQRAEWLEANSDPISPSNPLGSRLTSSNGEDVTIISIDPMSCSRGRVDANSPQPSVDMRTPNPARIVYVGT